MPRTQRGGRDINRGTGVTQSRSSIYLILNWLSTTSCPPPCRTGKKGGDESDPPRNGGLLRPRIAARCPTPLSGPMRGRYRPYLSLREGSEKDHNGGAEGAGAGVPFFLFLGRFQIGPRRQGSAPPLRALDCSGPIRRDGGLRGKGEVGFRAERVLSAIPAS